MSLWELEYIGRKLDQDRDRLDSERRVGSMPIDKESENKYWENEIRRIHESHNRTKKNL